MRRRLSRIAVDIGARGWAGDLIGVSGALTQGDRVAVGGAENLLEGIEVRIMMSSTGATTSTTTPTSPKPPIR